MAIYNTIMHTAQQLQWQNFSQTFEFMTDTPYLALTGELWSIFCELYKEKWQYIENTLYNIIVCHGRPVVHGSV